jgi:hypothetical protein
MERILKSPFAINIYMRLCHGNQGDSLLRNYTSSKLEFSTVRKKVEKEGFK